MYKILIFTEIVITLILIVLLLEMGLVNILKTIRSKSESLKVDLILGGIILLLCVVLFCHDDLGNTIVQARALIDFVINGDIMKFSKDSVFKIPYSIVVFILISLWNLLLLGIGRIFNPTFWSEYYISYDFNVLYFIYNKILIVAFFIFVAFVMYKIGLVLGLDKQKSKWLSFAWLINPIALYNIAYGQIDMFGILFMMFGIYYFLQNKYTKASIFIAISAVFKPFALIFYLPLIVLVEKNIVKVIKYFGIAVLGWGIPILFAGIGSGMANFHFHSAGSFNLLFSLVFDTPNGVAPIFVTIFIVILIVCYVKEIKDINNLKRWIIYIPTLVLGVLFCTIYWLGNWPVWLAPFLVILIFQFKNINIASILNVGISAVYFCCNLVLVDIDLMRNGLLNDIFGYGRCDQSIAPIIHLDGLISSDVYSALFFAVMLGYLIVKYPKDNCDNSDYVNSLSIESVRKNIWLTNIPIIVYIVMMTCVFAFSL